MEAVLLAVTAVIVTYNSAAVIDDCLRALVTMAPEAKVIVVDNASVDGTAAAVRRWPSVTLIVNQTNRGFAGGVNQGVGQIEEHQTVLLLNPDVQLLTPIDKVMSAASEYGLAAGKLLDADGGAQTGFNVRRFPTPLSLIFENLGINRFWPGNAVNRRYRYLDRDPDQTGFVEQPAGAFLLFRRDVWQKIHGFDEQFHPVWFEDVDFCQRAVAAGYQIRYEHTVQARHQGGHSVGELPAVDRATYWCVSLLRYSHKHFGRLAYRCVAGAVVLGSMARILVGPRLLAGPRLPVKQGLTATSKQERRLTPQIGYLKIMGFASACLVSPSRLGRPI